MRRFAPKSGQIADVSICPLCADCVAKVFLAFGRETLIQDRARTSNNDSKEPTLRSELLQISISQSQLGDFCNTICQKRTFAFSERQLCEAVRGAIWKVPNELTIDRPAASSADASSRRCARPGGTRPGASHRPGPDRPRIWASQCRRRTGRQA